MRFGRRGVRSLPVAAGFALVAVSGCAGEPGADAQDEGQEGQKQEPSAGEVLSETTPDGHKLREVPAEEAPSVELEVEPDAHDGWDLHLATEGFEFTPEESGGDAQGGQGHAHLYIDGEKYARVYGPWFHLPAEAVAGEERTLTVMLTANDHTAWAAEGEPVQAEHQVDGAEADGSHGHDEGAE
ncbi:hypothetical protein [Allosalinactinospora lopnorensis]|uniref:hypothetical protein n=1 Tax=Allosalinactinospora lopnorensis TaxID=1352348 RepID=UPI000698E921|nr:hypothetical protein [Allosalinactinospora lopnorensis]